MIQPPLLEYALTTRPLPLQQGGTGEVTIVAGNPGSYSDIADDNYVAPATLVFDFGAGLTADPGTMAVSAVYRPAGGQAISWGAPQRSGSRFTFSAPPGQKLFPHDSLTFRFEKITLDNQPTAVALALTETASTPGDPANPGIWPAYPSAPRATSRTIGIFPADFRIDSFAAGKSVAVPGQAITLSWAATRLAGTSFTLSFVRDGAVQVIDRHRDGTPLQATDTYPSSAHDPGVSLTVNRTTSFSLAVTYTDSETVTAERQVIVSVPDPTIVNFAATPTTGLMVGDPVQLSWKTLAADYCEINPPLDGVNSGVQNTGGATIYPLRYNRYTLTAGGRGMNTRRSLVLFPMSPGWTVQTNTAPWQSPIAPLLLATEQRLLIFPASPKFSPIGVGTNPIYSSPNGENWILNTPDAPVPVRERGAGLSDSLNGKIWVLGGRGRQAVLNDVWSSPDGRTWTCMTGNAQWPARSDFGCVWFDDKYWVMGGVDASGDLLNDIWTSTNGKDWTRGTNPPWTPRSAFGLAVFDDKLWIVGGNTAQGATGEVWYSGDGVDWAQQQSGGGHHGGGSSGPPARVGYQLFGDCKQLYAFAGAIDDGGTNPPVFYSMDFNGQWLASSPPPGLPTTAKFFGSTTYNDSLWLAGGAPTNATGRAIWAFRSNQQ